MWRGDHHHQPRRIDRVREAHLVKPKSILRGVIGSDTLEFDIGVDNTRFTSPVKVGVRSIARRYWVRVAPRCLCRTAGRRAGKIVGVMAVDSVDVGWK
jgi:hypothetical protein